MQAAENRHENNTDHTSLNEFEELIAQGAYHLALPLCRVLSECQAKNRELAETIEDCIHRRDVFLRESRFLSNGLIHLASDPNSASHGVVQPRPNEAAGRARAAYAAAIKLEEPAPLRPQSSQGLTAEAPTNISSTG